jgi:serine/threonine protein phosphatase PrpC
LGDFSYKNNAQLDAKYQAVTAFPDVRSFPKQDVEFIILACDGLWDVKSPVEVVTAIHTRFYTTLNKKKKISDKNL